MNLKFEIFDADTGELLAHRYCQYEMNFHNKDDAGFKTALSWIQCCVRGIKFKDKKALSLNVLFTPDMVNSDLFNGFDREDFNKKAEAFLV